MDRKLGGTSEVLYLIATPTMIRDYVHWGHCSLVSTIRKGIYGINGTGGARRSGVALVIGTSRFVAGKQSQGPSVSKKWISIAREFGRKGIGTGLYGRSVEGSIVAWS